MTTITVPGLMPKSNTVTTGPGVVGLGIPIVPTLAPVPAISTVPVPVVYSSTCWLCGAMKIEDPKLKAKGFTPLWGNTELMQKKQRAAKILLAEDGKEGKDIAEGDRVCQTCANQIHRRICIMEGKPFVSQSQVKKQKPVKTKAKWLDETSSEDDDVSILDSNSSSVGFLGTKPRRPSPPKKKKQSDTAAAATTAKITTMKATATKTGRSVKAPDRFSEKIDAEKASNNKRSQNRATIPKSNAQNNEFFQHTDTSPPKNKVSSVSSLNLSSIFGEDNSICVEICIDNVASAISAFKGGARRIELCSALSEGGLTPSCGFLREVKSLVKIPVFPMIRPRGGDFLYTDGEIDVMKYDIKNYKHNGADGFVFGVLDKNGFVDVAKCRALLQAADPLPCTFHRAFDHVVDPLNSLETVIKLGFTRLLTSGQKSTAAEGIPLLKKLVEKAAGRISIMAGAGINPQCVGNVVARTGVREVHGSARIMVPSQMKIKNEKGSRVAMGQNPDDSSILVCNANAVAQIVKAAEDALEAGKLITIL